MPIRRNQRQGLILYGGWRIGRVPLNFGLPTLEQRQQHCIAKVSGRCRGTVKPKVVGQLLQRESNGHG